MAVLDQGFVSDQPEVTPPSVVAEQKEQQEQAQSPVTIQINQPTQTQGVQETVPTVPGVPTPETGEVAEPETILGNDNLPIEGVSTGDPDTWQWDKDVDGEGDRPDWLLDKYDTVADQAKSYPELQKQFGSFTGAPKDGIYGLNISEELAESGFQIEEDDPMLKLACEFAQSADMDQGGFDNMINVYGQIREYERQAMESQEVKDTAEEMKALGANGKQQLTDMLDWAKANLDPEFHEGFKGLAFKAEGIKALQAVIAQTQNLGMGRENTSPVLDDIHAKLYEMQFAKDEYGNRKVATDQKFAADYAALRAKADNL